MDERNFGNNNSRSMPGRSSQGPSLSRGSSGVSRNAGSMRGTLGEGKKTVSKERKPVQKPKKEKGFSFFGKKRNAVKEILPEDVNANVNVRKQAAPQNSVMPESSSSLGFDMDPSMSMQFPSNTDIPASNMGGFPPNAGMNTGMDMGTDMGMAQNVSNISDTMDQPMNMDMGVNTAYNGYDSQPAPEPAVSEEPELSTGFVMYDAPDHGMLVTPSSDDNAAADSGFSVPQPADAQYDDTELVGGDFYIGPLKPETAPFAETGDVVELKPEPEAEPVSEAEPETETAAEAASEPEPETAPETEDTAEPEPGAEAVSEPEPEPETAAETETDAVSEIEPGTVTEPETEAPAQPEPEPGIEPEVEVPAEPEPETETEPETEAPAEPEPEIYAETEPEAEAPAEFESVPEAEPEAEAPAEPEPEPVPEADTKTSANPAGFDKGIYLTPPLYNNQKPIARTVAPTVLDPEKAEILERADSRSADRLRNARRERAERSQRSMPRKERPQRPPKREARIDRNDRHRERDRDTYYDDLGYDQNTETQTTGTYTDRNTQNTGFNPTYPGMPENRTPVSGYTASRMGQTYGNNPMNARPSAMPGGTIPDPDRPLRERARDNSRNMAQDERRLRDQSPNRRSTDSLVFGVIPRATMSLIFLVVLIAVTGVFSVMKLEVTIPVLIIIMIIEVVMGIFLAQMPSFVSIFVAAGLTFVGAITGFLIPVCIGNAVMLSAGLVIKGE